MLQRFRATLCFSRKIILTDNASEYKFSHAMSNKLDVTAVTKFPLFSVVLINYFPYCIECSYNKFLFNPSVFQMLSWQISFQSFFFSQYVSMPLSQILVLILFLFPLCTEYFWQICFYVECVCAEFLKIILFLCVLSVLSMDFRFRSFVFSVYRCSDEDNAIICEQYEYVVG